MNGQQAPSLGNHHWVLETHRAVELVSNDALMATSIGAAKPATLTLTAVVAALNTRPNQSRRIRTDEEHWVYAERGALSRTADLVARTGKV